MTRRSPRPSAAVVIALAALAVAIGGTAFGAIGAIPSNDRFTACYQTSNDILNRIVVLAEPGEQCPNTYARVTWPATASSGTQGPQGPPGPVGPAGPQGPAGPAGPPATLKGPKPIRFFITRVVTAEVPNGGSVSCPRTYVAVGGGVMGDKTAPAMASFPVVNAKRVPTGWGAALTLMPRFRLYTLGHDERPSTDKASFPEHRHRFSLPPGLLRLRDPQGNVGKVTVYAVCVRVS